jgi:hypothetical protein
MPIGKYGTMSTRAVSTSRYRIFLAIALIAAFAWNPGHLQAQPFGTVQSFGGRQGWDILADFANTRFSPGWEGGSDVILADASQTPRTETDLLASFDGTLRDHAGNYRVRNEGVLIVDRPSRFGSGVAGFDGRATMAYFPGERSLFMPDSQPGSFSIDFWLHPNHITEGAVILRWRGALLNGDYPVLQDLRLEINDRRLHWVLTNLVVRVDRNRIVTTEPSRLSSRRSMVPRIWQHHQLRFDAFTGQLAYLIDGIPEDIRYLSESGREDGTARAIIFGSDTGDGVVVGQGYQGAMDELRITRDTSAGPQPARYSGDPGAVVSRPIDLGGSGAQLQHLQTRVHQPGGTEIRSYYRLSDVVVSNEPRTALDAEWKPFPRDGTIRGNERGRFLQLRFELLADVRREESPRLQAVDVRYLSAAPPPPPRLVTGRSIAGGVELTWNAVPDGDVQGYRVYFGERPMRYTGTAGLVSPTEAGTATSTVITGLRPDVPYVFAVESYDRYGQSSSLSREIEVRAGREGDRQ